jgi:hypothetical protein
MKTIIIGANEFLAWMSFNENINNKGFSPNSLGFEVNRQALEGVLMPGRTATETSTGLSGEILAACPCFRSNVFNYYSITSGGKVFATVIGTPSHTLKATLTGKTYDGYSDIIFYKDNLYISSADNIAKSDFTFTGADPDEDWWTTTAGGSTLTTGVYHKFLEFQGVLYVTNGNKIVSWDETTSTANDSAFTLPDGWVISDIAIINNYIYVAATHGTPNYTRTTSTKLYVWNGVNPTLWQSEYSLSIPNITSINEVNGKVIVTGGRSLYEFTGYGLRYIIYLSSTPNNWKQVVVHSGKLYFRSYLGIKCYDPANDSLTMPIHLSTEYSNVSTVNIGYYDFVDLFSIDGKFYRCSYNTNAGTFYSNYYIFPDTVQIKRWEILFDGALTTDCDYTVNIQDSSGIALESTSITFTNDGAIGKFVHTPTTSPIIDNFQATIAFNSSSNKAIKQIRIYYEPIGTSETK